jgi:transcriptional regulator with XRE-family HTH domain
MAAAVTYPDQLVFDGHAVQALRHARGWTGRQFADRLGCSAEMVRSVEGGRAGPSVKLLLRMAAVLDVPVTELVRRVQA